MKTKAPPGKLGGVFSYFWMEQLRQAFGTQGHNVIPTGVMKTKAPPGKLGGCFFSVWRTNNKTLLVQTYWKDISVDPKTRKVTM